MTADEIVASVQSHPPHADVLVAPAVRVLVDEVVRLRALVVDRETVEAALKRAEEDMAALEGDLSP